jgi:hypothetical protein
MIAFKQDTEIQVVISFDEKHDKIAEQSVETFKQDELVDAEIIDTNGDYVDLEYGDGTVSTGVLRSSFVVKREKKKKA